MNKVLLTGRIVRINNREKCSFFTIATYNPHAENKTDFVELTAFGSTAEFLNKNFEKGQAIEIEGSIRTGRNYQNDVIANEIRFCGNKVNKTDTSGFGEQLPELPDAFPDE